MSVVIHTCNQDHGFSSGFAVEVDGIRNAWPYKDEASLAWALQYALDWLKYMATLSEAEKAAIRRSQEIARTGDTGSAAASRQWQTT